MSKPRDSLAKLTEMGLMPLPIRTTQDTTNQEFEEDGESSPDAGEDKENMLAKLKPRYCSRCKKVKGVHAFEGALKTCTMCLIAKRKVKSDGPLSARGARELLGEKPLTGLRSGSQPGNGAKRRSVAAPSFEVAIVPIEAPLKVDNTDSPETVRATPRLAEHEMEVDTIDEALRAAAEVASKKACADLLKAEIVSAEIENRVHKAAIQDSEVKLREMKKQQDDDKQKAAVSTRRINLLKRKLEEYE